MTELTPDGIIKNFGLAKLQVVRDGDQSTVIDQYSQVPLQLHHPLYLDAASFPTVYLKTPSSGMLGGDVHEIEVRVGPGSELELRTQAATLAYPGPSSLSIDIDVAAGGKLTFLPHPLILGEDSQVTQKVRINLGPDACLEFSDTWCAGRIAMQEAWKFHRYDYCLEIFKTGNLAYRERWHLAPHNMAVTHPLICGEYTHFSTRFRFGATPNSEEGSLFPDASWEDSQGWRLERDGDLISRRCAKARSAVTC